MSEQKMTPPPPYPAIGGQVGIRMNRLNLNRLNLPTEVRYHCPQGGVEHSWQIVGGTMPVYLHGTRDELRRLASRLLYLAEDDQ